MKNTKDLPGYRDCDPETFNRAVAKYHAGAPLEPMPDEELWILYTKWLDVPDQTDVRTARGQAMRLQAIRYRDKLKAECVRRGLLDDGLKARMRQNDADVASKYPDVDPAVLEFITDFACHAAKSEAQYEVLRSTFRAGYCWYFAHMLKLAFGRGEVCWAAPFGHFVWVDTNGVPYDVEGVNFGEQEYHIPERYLGKHVRDFMRVPGDDTPGATDAEIEAIIQQYKSDREKGLVE